MKEKPKNESNSCGEEWTKCYTYFMIQVQVQIKEDWGPEKELKILTQKEGKVTCKFWKLFLIGNFSLLETFPYLELFLIGNFSLFGTFPYWNFPLFFLVLFLHAFLV